jgi:MFS family permease
MMAIVMMVMFMAPGMWVTSLPNILETHDAIWVLPYATALAPFFAIFSGLVFGALSDRKVNAEKLIAVLGTTGAVTLWLGFSSLQWGWHPGWYLFFQGITALLSGPLFPLMTKIKLVNLPNAARSFPIYTMFGTIGWILGGLVVSWFDLDASADAGRLAAYIRVAMGGLCLLMPATPPTDIESRGWKAALGLSAFQLLKDRELRMLYIASALFIVPCMAFFMITPIMLKEFGSTNPTAQMTLGQGVEIFAMIALSLLAGRFRIRWLLVIGMILGFARFALFAIGGELGVIAFIWLGIALHGPIFTFTTVAGRMFLDKRVPGTMRGQAQSLYQLLVFSVAGIAGAFFCGWLYDQQINELHHNWGMYWAILAASVCIPLIYFFIGAVRMGSEKATRNTAS